MAEHHQFQHAFCKRDWTFRKRRTASLLRRPLQFGRESANLGRRKIQSKDRGMTDHSSGTEDGE
ncbi:hypothetical protein, partial [Mesorhizobium sp. M1A.F.Ca.IN.020.03.2.1]|uniref:hypothetical protein n=1 Tax=Mesorhizobium sp. M1A.F.Ca.IN.020.03.2.1 TaxID=2496769 RepID=UPI0019D4C1E4